MRVVCIGEVVVDWLAKDIGQPFNSQTQFIRDVGGNAANVAVGLSRLGVKTELIGKVGDDFHASFIKDFLGIQGVGLTNLVTDPKYPTTQCYINTLLDNSHTFVEWPKDHAARMLEAREVDESIFEGAWALCATGISMTYNPRRQAIEKATKLAEKHGLLISFDASLPPDSDGEAYAATEAQLKKAHILKFNEKELRYWSGHNGSFEEAATAVFEKFQPLAVCATASSRGSFLVTEDFTHCIDPFRVESVDELGAGDAYIAGFLAGIYSKLGKNSRLENLAALSVRDWFDIGCLANACGALVTTKYGACAGLPNLNEISTLVASLGA
jgi:fructokinase